MNKIELVFNLYKDSPLVSKSFKSEVERKFKLNKEQIRNLFINIQNYQVKKYGGRLTNDSKSFRYFELSSINSNANNRHYSRLRRVK